jgi:hypothetical protein
MFRRLVLLATHLVALALGFAGGVYVLPILTAPKGPTAVELKAAMEAAQFKATFARNLPGSDFLHWGEGEVRLSRERIAHEGRLAPGPDYKLYLTRTHVDTKAAFLAIKREATLVGDVKTFNGFIVAVPPAVDVGAHVSVVVWCEAFSQFITSAKYR